MTTLDDYRKPNTSKAMGIEIEGLVDAEHPTFMRGRYYGFFYAGLDGSIHSNVYRQVPVEFVSQPLGSEWLKKEIRKLYKRFSIMANSSCGIHIHVSRQWLSEKKAGMIADFIRDLTDSQMVDLFGRVNNDYACRAAPLARSRYVAVNRTNTATIEFRVFASGDDPEWACYCVDMVRYLIEQAHVLNIDAIYAFRDSYKFKRESS